MGRRRRDGQFIIGLGVEVERQVHFGVGVEETG
jgi:hypothetical protein